MFLLNISWMSFVTPRFLGVLLLCALCIKKSCQSGFQKLLLKELFIHKEYDKLSRPVLNESTTVNVTFGLTLQQIIDVDEKNQMLRSNVWLDMSWFDPNLRWNPAEFGGVDEIRVPSTKVWKPDILLYNSADDRFDGTYHSNVIVSSTGNISWIPPGMFKSTCKINILWFPFDTQRCPLKFGSWTHKKHSLDMFIKNKSGGSIKEFIRNGEWKLLGVPVVKNVISYDCCPDDQYTDITFFIDIQRRTLYYGFNIILPCVLISSMSLLTFIMPPDSGEKISLGVTIVLSLMVFLLLVAETMPPTSDALPLIGIYFTCIMIMCSLSVVFTVLVLNCHHHGPEKKPMPQWMYKFICEGLAWIVLLRQPGQLERRKRSLRNSRLRQAEINGRQSQSLLANILDLEREPRVLFQNSGHNSIVTALDDAGYGDGNFCCYHRHELLVIIKELRTITAKVKKQEDKHDLKNDWKFAAMVIDRCCLIIFTIFTAVATLAIMMTAPHVLVS